MINRSTMEDSKIEEKVKEHVGDVDAYEAFDTFDQSGDGQITFAEFVGWAFKKNKEIVKEQQKNGEIKLQNDEDQEVES